MSNSNELYHYGVLGMKWGVRRGKYAKSYAKGVNKLKKLDSIANESEVEGKKYSYQAVNYRNKAARTLRAKKRQRLLDKAADREAMGAKLQYDAVKCREKGRKFYKKMEEVFDGVDVKQLNKEDVEYGKRYLNTILS